MTSPIRSIATPLFGTLLVLAMTPGAALADPPHEGEHGGNHAGNQARPAPSPPRAAPAQPAPQSGFQGGQRFGGGAAAARPGNTPPNGGQGGPAWHTAPAVRGNGGGAAPAYAGRPQGYAGQGYVNQGPAQNTRGQGYAYQGNADQRNQGQGNQRRDYQPQAYGQRPGYGSAPQYGDRGGYRGNGYARPGYNGGSGYDGGRWNNGWRHDQRYDWMGWRGAHRDIFHGSYYYPPYAGYGYARLGIGAVIDEAFMDEQYWIEDPGYYHLPPIYGPYRWVRYYNDCLLIDTETGQIADVLYNVFW